MSLLLFAALLTTAGTARAGSGPWMVSAGDASVYVGTEYQRLTELVVHEDGVETATVPVDDGLETTGVVAVASYGLRERIELELQVPWYRVEGNRTDGAVCASLGPQACATSQGLGVVSGRAEGLLLDELAGAPVSLSVSGILRLGAFTSDTRARLTNLSEGTTDLGGALALGRSGGLAGGFWSGWAEVGWRHRFPNTERRGEAIPGGELTADGDLLGGLQPWWSVGPSVSLLHRPGGFDFADIDLTSPDRFAELRVLSLRAGGKLVLRSSERTSFVVSAHKAVVVRNNPTPFSLGVGLSVQPRRKRDA